MLVTHDMVEAKQLCDQIAVLDRAGICACGTPAGLIAGSGQTVVMVLLQRHHDR